jgi:hypothetical protein
MPAASSNNTMVITAVVTVAAMLVLGAVVGLGVWLWRRNRQHSGHDPAASCRAVEEKTPQAVGHLHYSGAQPATNVAAPAGPAPRMPGPLLGSNPISPSGRGNVRVGGATDATIYWADSGAVAQSARGQRPGSNQ